MGRRLEERTLTRDLARLISRAQENEHTAGFLNAKLEGSGQVEVSSTLHTSLSEFTKDFVHFAKCLTGREFSPELLFLAAKRKFGKN